MRQKAIVNLSERIDTGRKATSPEERRKNIDTVKGLIGGRFIEEDIRSKIYGSHATTDIESAIRRSEIELADYELKQGLLSLSTIPAQKQLSYVGEELCRRNGDSTERVETTKQIAALAQRF